MITKNIRVDYGTWKKVKMYAAEKELPIGTVVSSLINKELSQKSIRDNIIAKKEK